MAEVTVAQTLVCGVGQPDHTCDQPAVGALAVHVHAGGVAAATQPRQPAVLFLCVRHLAAFGEPAEAVFPPDEPAAAGPIGFPPGAGTRGA